MEIGEKEVIKKEEEIQEVVLEKEVTMIHMINVIKEEGQEVKKMEGINMKIIGVLKIIKIKVKVEAIVKKK